MRVPGWCESCHRIRQVKVSSAGMVMMSRGAATGICSDCEDKQDQRRRDRGRRDGNG